MPGHGRPRNRTAPPVARCVPRLLERLRRWFRYQAALSSLQSVTAQTMHDTWISRGDFHAIASAYAVGLDYGRIGPLRFRKIEPRDLPTCFAFAASLCAVDERAGFRGALDLASNSTLEGAKTGSEEVACFFGYFALAGELIALGQLAPIAAASAEVSVTVSPGFRNNAVGGSLLHELLRRARSCDYAELVACVDCPNPPAVRMLLRLGFEPEPAYGPTRQRFRKALA